MRVKVLMDCCLITKLLQDRGRWMGENRSGLEGGKGGRRGLRYAEAMTTVVLI